MEQPTQLLTMKLHIPPPRSRTVERLRLVERLNAAMRGRFTLISAPAGFGKTTLLSEWRRTYSHKHLRLAWVSLDEGDNDPTRFWTYCIEALEKMEPGIGEHALRLLTSSPPVPPESILTTLINTLTTLPDAAWESGDIALVLDDYHVVEALSIHQSVTFLLDHLPAHLHLVIATRTDPPLPLARLRVRDSLTELRASDLRFTLDETQAFLKQCMGLQLSLEDATQLMRRTEGWIAGLQLAALSLQRSTDTSGFIETFTGSHRYILDYLAEEVLSRQSESIKNFLLQTSILSNLSPALCAAVTEREDSQALLITLEKSNLFLVPLDHQRHWYRYHALFKNFLQSYLEQEHPEQIDVLYQRASEWYVQHGQIDEAIFYALAGASFERAAQLIEQVARITWMHGEAVTLLRWLDRLPEDILCSRPPLSLFYAWSLITLGRGDRAEKFLDDAEHGLHTMMDASGTQTIRTSWSSHDILIELLTLRSTLARYWRDAPRTIELSRQLLNQVPTNNAIFRSLIALNLGYAYRIRGDVTEGIQAFTESITYGKIAQNIYMTLLASSNLAHLQIIRGTLRQASETLEHIVTYASKYGSHHSPAMVMIYIKKSMLLYEWNNLDAAAMQLMQGMELAQQSEDDRLLVYTHLALARVLQAQGKLEDAHDHVAQANLIVQTSSHLTYLAQRIGVAQTRLALAQGNLVTVSQWIETLSRSTGDDQFDYKNEEGCLLLARIFIMQNRMREALVVVERLLQGAKMRERIHTMVEILVLQAIASSQLGEMTKALSCLQRALILAKPEGYCRIFLDEGDIIAPLLLILLAKQEVSPNEKVSQIYVGKLIAELRKSNPSLASAGNVATSPLANQAIEHPLSKREMDVLRRLVSGLSNQAIAREMMLEISTVKSHLKHIYHKLNVENRTQAIAYVKELHLL